jgi:phenylalanyl-tRNA synthetase beta chain
MKFSVNWLKQWVNIDTGADQLADMLTAAGLEVDSIAPVAAEFNHVVIAEIESCQPHPDADKLSVCSVNDGTDTRLQVVCGAPNAKAGSRFPFARLGASIGSDLTIKEVKLRGVESQGMLCSARELGLSDDHSGLMQLPEDAPLGQDFRDWLGLNDHSIEIDLTPNRADCLSISGLARDVSAICDAEFTPREYTAVQAQMDDQFPISLEQPEDCARYVGRIIRAIDPAAKTPLWLQESLRRCGLRPISPVVDVTNFVLLELGQPMHGFDFDQLEKEIIVRRGRPGEKLKLLDGSEVELDDGVLAICDASGPVALAGIMGGDATAVNDQTTNVLFESAWFRPAVIMGKARAYGLHTDASHRFERGVDPQGQVRAIERATELLLEICGGTAGPVLLAEETEKLPCNQQVLLRHDRLNRLVGITFKPDEVENILLRLGMTVEKTSDGWQVTAPSTRMDIAIEEDLIEEVARIHGYDRIPLSAPSGVLAVGSAASHDVSIRDLQQSMCTSGYQEAINYSFIDRKYLQAVHQDENVLPLANPLSAELDVMRTTLLPGLLNSLSYNARRQQTRVRLFETGVAYLQQESLLEVNRVCAVATGAALPEQWSETSRPLDFYDIKGDVERLVALRGDQSAIFEPFNQPWAHPGASAAVVLGGSFIGWCGAIHPSVLKSLDIEGQVFAFELDLDPLQKRELELTKSISRFPSIRRDLSFWLPESVTFDQVESVVTGSIGDLLQKLVIFDVYQENKLKKTYKSVAIGLILQHVSSTLTDEIVDPVVQTVINDLEQHLGASLRG